MGKWTSHHRETNIDIPKHDGDIRIRNVFLKPRSFIFSDAYEALREADLVVIGPGDLYTSIIPNLLAEGFVDAIRERTGKLAFVMNLMTKWGETNDFTASNFAREVLSYLKQDRFDYIICNSLPIRKDLVKKYAAEKAFPSGSIRPNCASRLLKYPGRGDPANQHRAA